MPSLPDPATPIDPEALLRRIEAMLDERHVNLANAVTRQIGDMQLRLDESLPAVMGGITAVITRLEQLDALVRQSGIERAEVRRRLAALEQALGRPVPIFDAPGD